MTQCKRKAGAQPSGYGPRLGRPKVEMWGRTRPRGGKRTTTRLWVVGPNAERRKLRQDEEEGVAELDRKGGRGRRVFHFSKSFSYFVFKAKFKCKPNQIQLEFKIHFSIQIKMINFGKFSKIIFYNFLNAFIS